MGHTIEMSAPNTTYSQRECLWSPTPPAPTPSFLFFIAMPPHIFFRNPFRTCITWPHLIPFLSQKNNLFSPNKRNKNKNKMSSILTLCFTLKFVLLGFCNSYGPQIPCYSMDHLTLSHFLLF